MADEGIGEDGEMSMQKEGALPNRFEIMRQVENSYRTQVPMVEKPEQVWTLLDEGEFLKIGLKRHRSAFIESALHDWEWRDGVFRFYGHSSDLGDKPDLVIVYER